MTYLPAASTAASTSGAWLSGSTSSKVAAMVPSGAMTNVMRWAKPRVVPTP